MDGFTAFFGNLSSTKRDFKTQKVRVVTFFKQFARYVVVYLCLLNSFAGSVDKEYDNLVVTSCGYIKQDVATKSVEFKEIKV